MTYRWWICSYEVAKDDRALKVKGDDNLSDIMMKPLSSGRFEMLTKRIGMTKTMNKNLVPKEVTSEGAC